MTEKSTHEAIAAARAGVVAPPTIQVMDALTGPGFKAAMDPLFEGAPRFLDRLAAARPFGSLDALFARARAIAQTMPLDERIELIDAHPRLGAAPASVSAMSFVEQGYDREAADAAAGTAAAGTAAAAESAAEADAERARLAAELDRLNAAYEERFGFRYCVNVAGRSREALLPGMAAALEVDRAAEVARAIDAVVDIARDRYRRLEAEAAAAQQGAGA